VGWLLWVLIAVALAVGEVLTPGLFFLGPVALAAGAAADVHPMLLRMIDFLKQRGITAFLTSLTSGEWEARPLYEKLYCLRGDMENRIKEQFSLFADRVSAETMRANQMRLYLSAMAYILVSGLRRLGLKETELAQAQVSTIRTKLLKIGAQIRVTVRKVWVSMASSYPWQGLYQQVWANLRC